MYNKYRVHYECVGGWKTVDLHAWRTEDDMNFIIIYQMF